MSTVVNGHVVGQWSVRCPTSPGQPVEMDRDGCCTACGQYLPPSDPVLK